WWLREPWRDPLVAAALFTCGALLYLAGFDMLVSGEVEVRLSVQLSVLAFACCGSILRARRPVLALTIGMTAIALAAALSVNGTFGSSVPLLLVVMDQLFAATLYGSRRTSRAMVVLAAVILVGSGVVTFALTGDWRQALV